MLTELQARTLLDECEARMGTRLDRLRARLAAERKNPTPLLWELVVLHSATFVGSVRHEPHDGAADVELTLSTGEIIWLEAAYLGFRDAERIDALRSFVWWVRKALHDTGARVADLELDFDFRVVESGAGYNDTPKPVMNPPAMNEWKAISRSADWNQFSAALQGTRPASVIWDLGTKANMVVRARRPSHRGSIFPALWGIDRVTEHPLYHVLREKARRAKLRARKERQREPLVVCAGSGEVHNLFSAGGVDNVTAKKVALAALSDTSKWSKIERLNGLRRDAHIKTRVSGSRYISSVMVVGLESRHEYGQRSSGRFARLETFGNDEADVCLSGSAREALSRMNFNHVTYGPQWEQWNEPGRGADQGELNLARARKDTGSVLMQPRQDGGIDLEIPTTFVLRLLSGDALSSEFGTSPGSLMGRAAEAIRSGARIERAEFVGGDSKSREPDRLLLSIGPPNPPIVARKSEVVHPTRDSSLKDKTPPGPRRSGS